MNANVIKAKTKRCSMKKLQTMIDYTASMIRENRIEHARLKKELDKLLQEFDTNED